jgi:hypothetical protein
LDSWRDSDAALEVTATHLSGFDSAETLAKVVLVNALYYTNVFAVTRVAERFTTVLRGMEQKNWTPELIEQMAVVQLGPNGTKPSRLISLASKFAHFFMDSRRFPIYDDFAKRTIASHTGGTLTALESSYPTYCTAFDSLANQVHVGESPRRLDRYLWVQGQFEEFKRKGKARSSELDRVFRDGGWPPSIK